MRRKKVKDEDKTPFAPDWKPSEPLPKPPPIVEPPPYVPDEKYAALERDDKGRLKVRSVDIGSKPAFRRKVVVGVFIFLIACSGLTFAVNNWPEPWGGNPDWNTLTEYFTVTAWVTVTDSDEHVLTAMTLWVFNNSEWNQVIEHSYSEMQDIHYFGRVPLGYYVTVRASTDWGNWSVPAGLPRALRLNSTVGSDEIAWLWFENTIHLKIVGSAGA